MAPMWRMAILHVLFIITCFVHEVHCEVLRPPYFNLARGKPIAATSTCGEDSLGDPITETYCHLTLPGQSGADTEGSLCFDCNKQTHPHPISNAIDEDNTNTWVSPPLSRGSEFSEVNITINLCQVRYPNWPACFCSRNK